MKGTPRVLVAGDFMVDVTLSVRDAGAPQRPDAEVPAYRVATAEAGPGGAGTCARLLLTAGIEVWPLGTVGDDAFGRMLLAELAQLGAATEYLSIIAGQPTRQRHWITDGDRPTMRFDVDPEPGAVSAPPPPPLAGFDLVLVSDFGLGGADGLRELPLSERPALSVVSTMDATAAPAYAWAGVFVTGLDDHAAAGAPLLAGRSPATAEEAMEPLARAIRAAGFPGCIVVTAGSSGVLVLEPGGNVRRTASRARQVRNVVGAGDTFVAALCAGLVRGMPVEQAVRVGVEAASASVETPGVGLASLAGFFR